MCTCPHQGEDNLESDRQPPCNRSTLEVHTIIEPVRNLDSNTDKYGLAGDQSSTLFGFTELGLICWDSGCLYAGTDTSYVSRYHHVWDRERGGLQYCAYLLPCSAMLLNDDDEVRTHDNERHSKPHAPPPA